jgi:hypothetical protein
MEALYTLTQAVTLLACVSDVQGSILGCGFSYDVEDFR